MKIYLCFLVFGGDHLSGGATGKAEVTRALAVTTQQFAQEVQLRMFFEGRLVEVERHAKLTKRGTRELGRYCKGGNVAPAATLGLHVDEILRATGADFDTDDDVRKFKGAPSNPPDPPPNHIQMQISKELRPTPLTPHAEIHKP